MNPAGTTLHTPTVYRSTARFARHVTGRLAGGAGLILASLDYDHMGYFLKTYGSLRVERALEQCWRLLDLRLEGFDAAVLRSSLDETEVALTGLDASALAGLLRAHARDVADAGALLFGSRHPRFGYTAVIGGTPGSGAAIVESGAILRGQASSNQHALEATKLASGRGEVRVVQPDEPPTLRSNGISSSLWSRLAACDPAGVREMSLSFREFESRAGASPAGVLLLVTPRFDAPAFDAPTHDEGGRTLLPDGTTAGKLGYLNRVFGEHLTPNLVVERVLDDLARTCPWPHDLSCAGSTLLLRTHAELSGLAALPGLLEWALAARNATNQELGGVITVSHVQIALLSASHARYAIDLAHRVYKLPCRLVHESGVFLHDCRDIAEAELAAMSLRYGAEAAAEIVGA
jgi:hypothetical protein